MTHDKFCPSTQDDLPLWQPPCTVCEMLVKVRANEREQAAQRVNDHIGRYGIPQPDWTQVDAATWYEAHIAAARGEDRK